MTGVYLFWAWVVVSSLAVLFAAHSRPGRWACRLYRPLLLVAFSLVTLAAVGRYLVHASWGKLDSAIGLWYLQALINPAVRMIVESEPLASLLYEPLAELRMGGGNRLGAGVALVLWEVMAEDLFLGNLFWLGVGTLWLWFVRRRTEASEEPPEI